MICILFIVILASCSSMTHSMEYAALANDSQTNEKTVTTHKPQQEQGSIPWEDDPANDNLWRVNLPKFIQQKCNARELTQEQSQFLEQLQKVSFPCVMDEENLSMLESLGYMHLFNVEETNDGWCIQHGPLQQKMKPGHREQLNKITS